MTRKPARTKTITCPNCQGDKFFIIPAHEVDNGENNNPFNYDKFLGEDGCEYVFETCMMCEGEGTIQRRIKYIR